MNTPIHRQSIVVIYTMSVLKGISFNRIQSKCVAPWIIIIVFLLTISTHLHETFYGHSTDDEEENEHGV